MLPLFPNLRLHTFGCLSALVLALSFTKAAAAPSEPDEDDTTIVDSVFEEPEAPPEQAKPKPIEHTLKSTKGYLAIYSNPPGALIVFNNRKHGKTPAIVKLTKKINRIVLRMRGYDWYDVMIEGNTLRREMSVELRKTGTAPKAAATTTAPAPEKHDSIPSTAAVAVGNKPAPTPPSAPATPPVATVPVVKPAEPKPVVIASKASPETVITAAAAPAPPTPPPPPTPVYPPPMPEPPNSPASVSIGMVFFSSSPAGADITIDGRPTGKQTPIKITLSAGKHHVAIARDGLKGETDYEVNPGRNKALHLSLQ